MTATPPSPLSDLIGQHIGNYHVEEILGTGGMGQVFRARHVLLDRMVALKVLHPSLLGDPLIQARFRHEAKAAAMLRHPHVVEVFDFHEQDGYAYLVMELVMGGSLRHIIQEERHRDPDWPLVRSLDLVRQAAEGLGYAHAQGMVHRDIKPDNLLIQPDADSGQSILKVGDFGLARIGQGSGLTAANTAMGTPAYMSPEQCQGIELDGRSDLYGLGVVLYELVTGQLPFQFNTTSEAVYKHVFHTPDPPRRYRPDLPERLEALILRCLAKDPAKRYQTMADLALALQAVVASIQQAAAAPPPATIAEAPTEYLIMPDPPSKGHVNLTPPMSPPIGAIEPVAVALLSVYDSHGRRLQQSALHPGELLVGRLPTSDLHLDAPHVSRRHLSIQVGAHQVHVTDLGSSLGTFVQKQRLVPHQSVPWPIGVQLQVGPFVLILEASSEPQASAAETVVEALPEHNPYAPPPALFDLDIEPSVQSLAIEQPTAVLVTITSQLLQSDTVVVSVSDFPEPWLTLPAPLRVEPQQPATTRLLVNVPRVSEAHAGEWLVQIHVRSLNHSHLTQSSAVRWVIQPFAEVSLVVQPPRQAGIREASYRVFVHNQGNARVTYRLMASDRDDQIQPLLSKDQVVLLPDERVQLQMQVEAAQQVVGGQRVIPIDLRVVGSDGSQAAMIAQFVHRSLISWWMLCLVLFMLAVVIGALFAFSFLRSSS
jgi:tRNA A-37 threonylcarbamoyl transferase component Bud32